MSNVQQTEDNEKHIERPQFNGDAVEPIPLKRVLPDPKQYPVESLGQIMAAATKRLTETIQAPSAICAQSVLAAATLAAQGHADVVIDGRNYPLSCFFLTIGESGERKSAVDREVMKEFREQENILGTVYASEKQSYDNEFAAYENDRTKAVKEGEDVKSLLDKLGNAPLAPLHPMRLCDDPTVEGIYKFTQFGQPSIGLFSDEGGRMIGGHGMTQENQIRTVTMLSKFWDGDPISRVRGGDGSSVLHGRRLSMHLMAQPAVVALLLTNEVIQGQGLLSRVLPCFPVSTSGTRFYQSVDLTIDSDMIAYHNRIREIIGVDHAVAENSRNELQPRCLTLSSAAKEAWVHFYNDIEFRLGVDGDLAPVRGFAAKVPEHALRLAGTLTLFDNLLASEIPEKSMTGAINLAQFYVSEALRLFHSSVVPPELLQAERLHEWLTTYCTRDRPHFSLPDIYQLGPNSIRDAKTARKLVKILEQHGLVATAEVGALINGARRRTGWKLQNLVNNGQVNPANVAKAAKATDNISNISNISSSCGEGNPFSRDSDISDQISMKSQFCEGTSGPSVEDTDPPEHATEYAPPDESYYQ